MRVDNQKVVPAGLFPPAGWDVRCEITITEPAQEALQASLAKTSKAAAAQMQPQPNVSISRKAARTDDAAVALEERMRNAMIAFPGAKRSEEQPYSFPDGFSAPQVTMTFEPLPGLRAAQRHVLRIDDGVETYIVASIAEPSAQRLPELINTGILCVPWGQ